MRIDYCPNCNKAGLKYRNDKDDYMNLIPNHYANRKKWCPRCKVWVEPINKPYIGSKGRG